MGCLKSKPKAEGECPAGEAKEPSAQKTSGDGEGENENRIIVNSNEVSGL